MVDFNDIDLDAQKDVFIAAVEGLFDSLSKLDPSTDTNIPVGAKRFFDPGGGYRFQEYDGTNWADLTINALVDMPASGSSLVVNTTYLIEDGVLPNVLYLPANPSNGDIIRFYNPDLDITTGTVAVDSSTNHLIQTSSFTNQSLGTSTTTNVELNGETIDPSKTEWVNAAVRRSTDSPVAGIVSLDSETSFTIDGSDPGFGGALQSFLIGYQVFQPSLYDIDALFIEFSYHAQNKTWGLSLVGPTARSVLFNERNVPIQGISSGSATTVEEAIKALGNTIFSTNRTLVGVGGPSAVRNDLYDGKLVFNGTTDRTRPMSSDSQGGRKVIYNFGTANFILQCNLDASGNYAGSGAEFSVLAKSGSGVTAATSTDITIPPGEYAEIMRAQADDSVAYVYGSAGVTKA